MVHENDLIRFNKYSGQPIFLAPDMVDSFSGCPESGDYRYRYYIYTLSDETGIRYVGQTNWPSTRLSSHMCNGGRGRDKTRRGQWIKALMDAHKGPLMMIIETCPIYRANDRERYWFEYYSNLGCDLLNRVYKPREIKVKLPESAIEQLRCVGQGDIAKGVEIVLEAYRKPKQD